MADALSTRLLLSRRDLKINQDDLARTAGVSRAYISDLERGKVENPTADVIVALATALQVRPEYLMGWSDDALGESRPASISEGRVVYQVGSPAEYRLVQEMLELFTELAPENQRILLQLADQLRRANYARVVE